MDGQVKLLLFSVVVMSSVTKADVQNDIQAVEVLIGIRNEQMAVL
jgi:hypothetical protein